MIDLDPVLAPLLFLAANAAILFLILGPNRRKEQPPPPISPAGKAGGKLAAGDILGWEFEYARVTASEAMQDRHTMINFYLLIVGIVTSGVIAVVGAGSGLPASAGTLLLWVLCGIGWLYFLKIIRLRQAWHNSAQAMGQIKEFYLRHSRDLEYDLLKQAFLWRGKSLPAPHGLWTVFFYSAMLIGYLDSIAFVAGAALLSGGALQGTLSAWTWLALSVLGVLYFSLHAALYVLFLKPEGLPAQDAAAVGS